MSDLDEGRDVRAAFGTLLDDEPASPWSASDDVARGRALQRRRRTRAGAGVGLVAALVMVFGVFGPWRPQPTVVVPPASPSVELEQQVTDTLTDLGWETDDLARVRTEPGSPEVRVWTVHRADGDAGVKAKLVLRTWDASSFPEGSVPGGRLMAACSEDGACVMSYSFIQDCSGGPCWTETSTVVQQPYDALPVGTRIVSSWSLSPRAAAEIASTPAASDGTSPDPLETSAFLGQSGQSQLLGVVQRWLIDQGGSDVAPSPAPTPTSSASAEPSGIAAVTQVLEGFGFRVNTAQEFSGRNGWYFDVDVDPTADNPVDAVLTLAFFSDDGVAVGSERVAVEGSVMNGCDETTCERVDSITVPCPSNDCFQDWATTTTAAYDGVDPGTLVVFRSDGSRAIEAVVGVRSCPTCAPSGVGGAFLTLEQTQEVLAAAFVASAVEPSPSRPAIAACTNDQVKIVPAVDSTGGATGQRSVSIEVYARNPSISCTVEETPAAELRAGATPPRGLIYREGSIQSPGPQRGTAVLVDSEHAAVFVVSKYRCDAGAIGVADGIDVRLPGSSTSTVVGLPDGLGLELCGGSATDAGNTVWVSVFTPREGGVS